MIKVAIMGVGGRMGRSILSTLSKDEEILIVGATERYGHELIGMDAGELLSKKIGVKITSDLEEACSNADVIVDFTTPESSVQCALYAREHSKAMVIGTTGFDNEQLMELKESARDFPCVMSPNMSIGVNVVFEISKMIATLLGKDYDVEIVEVHHRYKEDAPSGTAIRLGECVAEGLGFDFNRVARYSRHGRIGKRSTEEIGIQSLRGGDVVGDHTVMFLGKGERVELSHKALSRENFSLGVLRAVKWVFGKPPGMYSMREVLGLAS